MLQGQRILKMDGRNYVGALGAPGALAALGALGALGAGSVGSVWERLGAPGRAWERFCCQALPAIF